MTGGRSLLTLACVVFAVSSCSPQLLERAMLSKATNETKPGVRGGPYCGVYCMYAALHVLGSQVGIEDLLQRKYIRAPKGSSLPDLERMASDNGFQVTAFQNLNWTDLENLPFPRILHLSRGGCANDEHFVLLCGVSKGRVTLYDPPSVFKEITVAELLVDWDGVGAVVSQGNAGTVEFSRRSRFLMWWRALLVFCALATPLILFRWWLLAATVCAKTKRAVLLEVAVVGAVAVAAALLFHAFSTVGFLRNSCALADVYETKLQSLLPKIDAPKLERMLRDSDLVLVDARWARDYEAGHFPGAVSILPSSTVARVREITSSLPTSRAIVVYCQNASCGYAVHVAASLKKAGYWNILYFKDGWLGWQEYVRRNGEHQERRLD